MENENEQRAILGGGCMVLALAAMLLAVTLVCAILDKV